MIIFVGDKPSPRMIKGASAFTGAVCEPRLKQWISTVVPEQASYWVINRVDQRALETAINLAKNNETVKIVALGNEAAKALDSGNVSYFKMPHPSGRNRKLNNKKEVAKQLDACKNWLNN
jgi:hypothetical protein